MNTLFSIVPEVLVCLATLFRTTQLSSQCEHSGKYVISMNWDCCVFGAGTAVFASRAIHEKGFAPSTEELWEHSRKLRQQFGTGDPAGVHIDARGNKARIWGLRWRKAWGFQSGKLRIREHYTTDELRQKAGAPKLCGDRVFDRPCGLKNGPRKRPSL